MTVLNDIDHLRIEIAAVRNCCDRSDFDPLRAPGEQMRDNDYCAAIRAEFADTPEWEDWMVAPLLKEVTDYQTARQSAMDLCDTVMRTILPTWRV